MPGACRWRHPASTGFGGGTLIASIVELARSLGLGVVAEGVETEEQRRALSDLDCGSAQGFLFARPQPAENCRPAADLLLGVPVDA